MMTDDEPQEASADTETAPANETPPVIEEAATEAPAEQREDVWAICERWWTDHMPGSDLARNTDAWNHVHAAFFGDLKRRLKRGD